MKVVVSVIIFLGLSLQTAFSANDTLDIGSAQALLEAGMPTDALDLLQAGLDPSSTNVQEWFLLAMAAKSSNRPRESSTYLKKVIELDPEQAGRAKLELAQLAYTLGDAETAKNYLTEVKSAKPPTKVGENIDQFLEMIERQGVPKQWRVNGSVGWMYDSNANAGPAIDSVLLFGLPFDLSSDAKEQSDNALLLQLGVDHNQGISDDLGWQTGFSLSRTDYNDIDNLDSLVLSGSTGPSWRITDTLVASLPLVANWVKIGHEETYYSYSYGVAPQLRYALSKKLSFNLGTTFSKKKYNNNSKRNSENYSLSPSFVYQFSPASFARVGLVGGKEDSGLAYCENELWGGNALYGYTFGDRLQATLNFGYTDTEYEGREAAYRVPRHDKTIRYGVDLAYHIKMLNSDLLLSVNRTVNDSNLVMYEYDRDQVAISWRISY
ncbi:surface lipoprotein assembly modifier [Desulfuromonas acetexigens]|nr:surface lipoprotein assembly modifier [Desulfuromonas acetexigens]